MMKIKLRIAASLVGLSLLGGCFSKSDSQINSDLGLIQNAIAKHFADTNGSWPSSLENLVPKYLKKVPTGKWVYNKATGEVFSKDLLIKDEKVRSKLEASFKNPASSFTPIFTYAGINIGTDVSSLKAKFPHSSYRVVPFSPDDWSGILQEYLVDVSAEDSADNIRDVKLRVMKVEGKSIHLSLIGGSQRGKDSSPSCNSILKKFENSFGVYQSSETKWVGEGDGKWLRRTWIKKNESLSLWCDEKGEKAYSIIFGEVPSPSL